MNIPKILLKLSDQHLLLLLGVGGLNECSYRVVDVQLLASWKSLRLPVALDHGEDPPEFGRLTHAFHFFGFVGLDLLVVFVDDRNATLLHFDFLSIVEVVVCELDPIAVWLLLSSRHLHRVGRFDAL